jgi:hypothetical protein
MPRGFLAVALRKTGMVSRLIQTSSWWCSSVLLSSICGVVGRFQPASQVCGAAACGGKACTAAKVSEAVVG